jgi:hypothetical protein
MPTLLSPKELTMQPAPDRFLRIFGIALMASAHSPLFEEPEKANRILREDVLTGKNALSDRELPLRRGAPGDAMLD